MNADNKPDMSPLTINPTRLDHTLEQLGRIGETPQGIPSPTQP